MSFLSSNERLIRPLRMMASATGFLQLPPELVLRVSSYLTTPELGHFRRTCKDIEATLFDSFAKEFFTKRQFMLEYVSLQALVDIANHPRLSRWISEVIIGVQAHVSLNSIHASSKPMEMYKSGYPSRHALRASGRDRDMLVEAFSKLPNLQTVGLRDYNARGRFRDGENAVWRSYGWSCNGLFTSDNARCLLDRDEIEASLPLILYALGHAHSTPGSLEVFLRHRDRLTPRSFNVLDGFMSSAIIPVLEGLKVLMLTTGGELNPDYMVPPEDPILDDDNGIEAPMRRFFHYTPNLETLRLNFQPYQWLAYRFLSWFAKPASVLSSPPGPAVSPVPPVSLPNLTKLDLGMLTVKDQTLLQVITKFDLTSLSLWKVTLQCDDPGAIYLPTHWADLLRKLSDTLPASTRLKHVLIGYASQKGHATVVPVFFKDSEGQQANRIEYRSRYGSNVKDWLRVRAAETAVEEPPVMDSSSESGNHSGEDTDGVDEEYEEDDESESSPSNSDDDEA